MEMNPELKKTLSEESPAEKRPYSSPKLVNLGAVHGIVMHGGCIGSDGNPGCSRS
jgi:hypothetical protein